MHNQFPPTNHPADQNFTISSTGWSKNRRICSNISHLFSAATTWAKTTIRIKAPGQLKHILSVQVNYVHPAKWSLRTTDLFAQQSPRQWKRTINNYDGYCNKNVICNLEYFATFSRKHVHLHLKFKPKVNICQDNGLSQISKLIVSSIEKVVCVSSLMTTCNN